MPIQVTPSTQYNAFNPLEVGNDYTQSQSSQSITITQPVPTAITETRNPTANDDLAAGYDTGDIWVNTTTNNYFILLDNANGAAEWADYNDSVAGYEFTGGFKDRNVGQSGATDSGSNVGYTQDMADNNRWLRFGFAASSQLANDVAYWTDPTPAATSGIGLFGGSYMPGGVSSLFDYGFYASSYSDAITSGSLQYTEASGTLDFTQCLPGDLALIRFDFNVVPQVTNTTVEVGLIWQTRDSNGDPTFTFALAGQPIFYGQGTVGRSFLNRPILSAYFASNEDVNARALPAIRADNPVLIQPLTILSTIQR